MENIYEHVSIVLFNVDFSSGKYLYSVLNFCQLGLQCGPPVSLLQCVVCDGHCLQVTSEGSVACNKQRVGEREERWGYRHTYIHIQLHSPSEAWLTTNIKVTHREDNHQHTTHTHTHVHMHGHTHTLTVFQHVQCLPPLCCWHESVSRRDGGIRCIGLSPLLLLPPLTLPLLQTETQGHTHTSVTRGNMARQWKHGMGMGYKVR